MTKWEYLSVEINGTEKYFAGFDSSDQANFKSINELGTDGWELVSVLFDPLTEEKLAYFKRLLD